MVRSSTVRISGSRQSSSRRAKVPVRSVFDRQRAGHDSTWRLGVPELRNEAVALRELKISDAPMLLKHVSGPSVQYITPPPQSVEDFTRFIRRARVERRRGTQLSLGIVPGGQSAPVGLAQIWAIEPDFSTAEWGFVLGESVWGTGLFGASARLLLDFAFDTLSVMRLEMRIVEDNVRANKAMRKLGATREGTLRCGFRRGDAFLDHAMWSILAEEWRARRSRFHESRA
jgi:RimJ/RimL family protein N-acetyltransferase